MELLLIGIVIAWFIISWMKNKHDEQMRKYSDWYDED